jgi:hypothetical protein
VFYHSVGSVGHVVHSVASGARNIDAIIFLHGWDRYGLHKRGAETRYARHVFLQLVGSVCQVVHSGVTQT